MSETIDLSLYVHLPWCFAKCPYCGFNSHTAGDDAPRARYVKALESDLRLEAERAGGRQLVSVFIGGGTPSFFKASEIGAIIDVIAAKFSLSPDIVAVTILITGCSATISLPAPVPTARSQEVTVIYGDTKSRGIP